MTELGEVSGTWSFTYGRKPRQKTIDAAMVAVRATPEAARALGAAGARPARKGRDVGSLGSLLEQVRSEVGRDLDGPDEQDWFMFTRLGVGLLLWPERYARVLRARFRPLLEQRRSPALSSLDELIEALDGQSVTDPADALRSAQHGTWTRIPRDVVNSAAELLRTAGAVALAVEASDRLLSDTVFIRFGEALKRERVQEVLAKHALVLKAHLPFAQDAVVAQVVSEREPAFSRLRRLLEEWPSDFALVEPIFIEPLKGRVAPRSRPARPGPTGAGYDRQWQWKNVGRNGGTVGADSHIEPAWTRTQGKGVRVAVIDNGMDVDHPALRQAITRGGWFVDNGVNAATFVELTKTNRSDFPRGDHGTFCCGMAAARVARDGARGAAPECDLLPVACLNDQVGTQITLARAISYAADPALEDRSPDPGDGADIVVSSLGPNVADWELSSALELALEYATQRGRSGRGCAIFWAASNGTVDIARDEVVSHDLVCAVSRSNHNDSYDGAASGEKLGLVAPGVDVYSTTSSGFGPSTGCSFAAPLVAGVAALVVAREPTLTWNQVVAKLKNTCDQVGGVDYVNGFSPLMGHGRINADRAVP